MKLLMLLLSAVLTSTFVKAQSLELSTNVYAIGNSTLATLNDSIGSYNTKYSGQALATVGLSFVSRNNFYYALEYGYNTPTRSTENSDYAGKGSVLNKFTIEASNKLNFVKFSFGKRYYIDKLGMNSVISVPVKYYSNIKSTSVFTDYTVGGTDVTTTTKVSPNEIVVGAWLGQSFMYPLYKKIIIGLDLNFGVDFSSTNGLFSSTENRMLENQVVYNKQLDYTVKQNKTTNVFVPVLSLRYILKSNFKDEHFKSVN